MRRRRRRRFDFESQLGSEIFRGTRAYLPAEPSDIIGLGRIQEDNLRDGVAIALMLLLPRSGRLNRLLGVSRRPASLASREPLLLAAFQHTGEAVFDGALKDAARN